MNNKFKQTEIGKIPEDWGVKELGNLLKEKGYIRGPFGSALRRPELKKEGIPVYEQQNAIYDNRIFKFFIDKDKYEEMKRFTVEENDLIISCSGTFGKVSIIKKDDLRGIISQALLILRPDINKVDPNFLKYFFISEKGFNSIASRSLGSVQVNIAKREVIEKIEIEIPPLPEQHAISSILSSLDAKIELNNNMNKTLEVIGQALFKKWFVDERKEEWEEGKLGEIGTFKNGINYLRDEVGDTEFSIVNVRDISNNKWILKNSLDKIKIDYDKAKDYLLGEKDIIIARSACPGKISLSLGTIDNTIYSGFSIRYRLNNLDYYFYISFILEHLNEELKNFSIGTTLSSVNQEVLKNIKISLPDKTTLEEFNKVIKPIFKQISINCFQSQTLASIRDALLPKLMSGEIRVK